MPVKILSNYLFNANEYLDSRQSLAKTVKDLRDWNFNLNVIPDGFEVFVEGNWYTYSSSKPEEINTGKFHLRSALSSGGGGGTGDGDSNISRPEELIFIGDSLGDVDDETGEFTPNN